MAPTLGYFVALLIKGMMIVSNCNEMMKFSQSELIGRNLCVPDEQSRTTVEAKSHVQCSISCHLLDNCKSFVYGEFNCYHYGNIVDVSDLTDKDGYNYFIMKDFNSFSTKTMEPKTTSEIASNANSTTPAPTTARTTPASVTTSITTYPSTTSTTTTSAPTTSSTTTAPTTSSTTTAPTTTSTTTTPTTTSTTTISTTTEKEKKYTLRKGKVPWDKAKTLCSFNGRLVCIHNKETNDKVTKLIEDSTPDSDVWIGLEAVSKEGPFRWTDGIEVSHDKNDGYFHDFYSEDPNLYDKEDNVGFAIIYSQQYRDSNLYRKWVDVPKSDGYWYVCEEP